jgi:hypothetical protein
MQPSKKPSRNPSGNPSGLPSVQPSTQPSVDPSGLPTNLPSSVPSMCPSGQPSGQPKMCPTLQPSLRPAASPLVIPASNRRSSQRGNHPCSRCLILHPILLVDRPSLRHCNRHVSPQIVQVSGRQLGRLGFHLRSLRFSQLLSLPPNRACIHPANQQRGRLVGPRINRLGSHQCIPRLCRLSSHHRSHLASHRSLRLGRPPANPRHFHRSNQRDDRKRIQPVNPRAVPLSSPAGNPAATLVHFRVNNRRANPRAFPRASHLASLFRVLP